MLVRWLCIVLLLGCMAGCDSDDNNGGLPDVFVEDTGSDMGEELDRGTEGTGLLGILFSAGAAISFALAIVGQPQPSMAGRRSTISRKGVPQ